ncbi:hypothetical protein ACLOJK_021338 [Asimina triloba]
MEKKSRTCRLRKKGRRTKVELQARWPEQEQEAEQGRCRERDESAALSGQESRCRKRNRGRPASPDEETQQDDETQPAAGGGEEDAARRAAARRGMRNDDALE